MGALYQWLGFILPKDAAPEQAAVFEEAFHKAPAKPLFAAFMEGQMARKMESCGDGDRRDCYSRGAQCHRRIGGRRGRDHNEGSPCSRSAGRHRRSIH
jgi:hypothetical protein